MELATLGAALADHLKSTYSGDIWRPEDPGYDDLRMVKNGMIDRRPALIARPADEQSVAALVNLAREREVPLAIRCGGHSVSGFGTCDGGVLIDMGAFNSV